MARLYKYNGAWETYQYLHDYIGFNTEPTNSVSFKSIGYDHKSWGDSDGSGYALDTNISTDIEYFRGGDHGWYDLNALASSLHAYPANAIDCQMTKDTLTSNAAMLTFSDATLVLIYLNKELGWKTLEEWTESGWILTALPIVSISGNFGMDNWLDNGDQGTPTSVSPDSVVTLYIGNLTEIPSYDVTKSYGVVQWQTIAGTTAGRTEFALVNSSGNIVAKNVSSSTHSFYQAKAAVCSSRDATVVTVYDSSNNAYNAFKYSLNGTDYYYVLDGTQADWTDDLSSIGYSLTPIEETLELLLGMRSSGSGANDWISVTYSAGTVYWAGILSDKDRYDAEKFGLQVHTNKWAGTIGGLVIDYTFGIELLAVYSDIGGSNPVEKGDGWDFGAIDATSTPLVYVGIKNNMGFATSVMSYRAKFTKHNSADITVYFTSEGGVATLWNNGIEKSVYWGGEYVLFDNGKTYTLIGVYNNDALLSGIDITTSSKTAQPYTTRIALKNNSGSSISRATRAVIRITNPQTDEREAWFLESKNNYSWSASSSSMELRNGFRKFFVENMERRLEVVRLEDANGNVVTPGGELYFGTGSYGRLELRKRSSFALTAAKVVYRSLPTTKKAWLRTDHNGETIGGLTNYFIYDENGNKVLYNDSATYSVLALYNSSVQQINFSDIALQKYTRDGVDYTILVNTGATSYEDVAYIIYKEA